MVMTKGNGTASWVNNILLLVITVLLSVNGTFLKGIYEQFIDQGKDFEKMKLEVGVRNAEVNNTLKDHEKRLDRHDVQISNLEMIR